MKSILSSTAMAVALIAGGSVSAMASDGDHNANVILEGVITATSCTVSANNDNANFFVGSFNYNEFTGNSLTQIGERLLPVQMDNCDGDDGQMVVSSAYANATEPTFFASTQNNNIGFMLQEEGGTTQIANQQAFDIDIASNSYVYNIPTGMSYMGNDLTVDAVGSYSTPIMISVYTNGEYTQP